MRGKTEIDVKGKGEAWRTAISEGKVRELRSVGRESCKGSTERRTAFDRVTDSNTTRAT